MIQDISPAHLNNHFDPTKTADENSIILFFTKEKKLLGRLDDSTQEISFPRFNDVKNISKEKLTYLFSIDDEDFFLMITDSENMDFLDVSAQDSVSSITSRLTVSSRVSPISVKPATRALWP